MAKTHLVTVNGEQFVARRGDVLLDAALVSGIHIPHDCRAGHCGTCRVRIVDGALFGGNGREGKACQCRVVTDVTVVVEDVPEVTTANARVTALRPVAPDVVDVCITPQRPIEYRPGQYLQVAFRGYPARCYSPTVPLDRFGDGRSFHLHIRRVPGGLVSSALGKEVAVGHRVRIKGPFGSAYLRAGQNNPLVLVAGGTGFAPIWSIADAAMRENSRREITLLVGARRIESLYMIPALWRLAHCPNVRITPVTDMRQTRSPVVQAGSLVDFLPRLYADDIVYAAGPPPLVKAITDVAEGNGAIWYADPFVPSSEQREGLLSRAANWLKGGSREPQPSAATPQLRR